jgi:sugar phosphate isomerase/epimerase
MRLAYNSNGWRRFPLAVAIERLSQIGFSAIELSCQPDQLFPLRFSREEAKQIKSLVDQFGISISNVHAGDRLLLGHGAEPSLITAEAAGRAKRLEVNKAAIDLAVELGVGMVAITSGVAHPQVPVSDSWKYLVDGVGECLEHASRAEVCLLIEPEPELFIRSTMDFLLLAEDLGHPLWLGLNLDIGHAHCLFEDIPAVIRETCNLLKHVHLEDISRRRHKHLLPGEGGINFDAVRDALLEIEYSHYVSVELFDHWQDPESAARRAKDYLASWNGSDCKNTAATLNEVTA